MKVVAEFVHSKEVFEKLMEYKIEEYQFWAIPLRVLI
jgi:EAL domain-containing protein (putative c-di-GMP-specific phosphodiesterase class I)